MTTLLALLLVVTSSRADLRDSTVEFASGELRIGDAPAVKGAKLKAGDVVQTGKDSAAVLSLADGTRVKLKSDSSVELTKLDAPADIKLGRGGAFLDVDKKTGAGFKFRTRTAVMGVRGTRFFTSYGRQGSEDVWMCVNEGAVSVTLENTRLMPTVVKEGQGVLLPGGKKVTPPRAYEWTKNLNWNMDAASGDVKDGLGIDEAYKEKKMLRQDYD